MPYASMKQEKFLRSKKPKIAEEFDEDIESDHDRVIRVSKEMEPKGLMAEDEISPEDKEEGEMAMRAEKNPSLIQESDKFNKLDDDYHEFEPDGMKSEEDEEDEGRKPSLFNHKTPAVHIMIKMGKKK